MNESRDGVLNLYFEAAADTCTNSRWSGATPKPSFAKVASALSCRIPFLRRIPRSLFPYRWTPSFDTRYGPLRYIFLCYSNSSHELSFFAYQFIVRCSWEFTYEETRYFVDILKRKITQVYIPTPIECYVSNLSKGTKLKLTEFVWQIKFQKMIEMI